MTSRECIFLFCVVFAAAFKLVADDSPAVDDARWLCEAAAAMGTENKDRKRGEAFLKVEANTLATCADLAGDRGECGFSDLRAGRGMSRYDERATSGFETLRRGDVEKCW